MNFKIRLLINTVIVGIVIIIGVIMTLSQWLIGWGEIMFVKLSKRCQAESKNSVSAHFKKIMIKLIVIGMQI